MLSSALDVGVHTPSYVLQLLLAHLSYPLGRSTDYEAASGELAPLRNQGAGGHDRAFAYLCSVEDRGAHPDQATVLDLAPVHDSQMAYDTPFAHYRRIPRIRVQHATVLYVRAGPYTDRLRVPPQHRPVPDARLLPQVHRPDDVGPRRDEGGFRNFRFFIAKGEQVTDGAIPLPAWLALAPAGADSLEAPIGDYARRISATSSPGVFNGERVPPNLSNGIRPAPRITARSTAFPPSLELAATSL